MMKSVLSGLLILISLACTNKPKSTLIVHETDEKHETVIYKEKKEKLKNLTQLDFKEIQKVCNADYERYGDIETKNCDALRFNSGMDDFRCKHFISVREGANILLGEFITSSINESHGYTYLLTCDTIGNVLDQLLFLRRDSMGKKRSRERTHLGYFSEDSLAILIFNYSENSNSPDSITEKIKDIWVIDKAGKFVKVGTHVLQKK